MLLYMMEMSQKDKAEGATKQVAPKPTPVNEPEVDKEEAAITKADIMKMNVATVRAYAKEQGLEDVDDKSGAELKRILVDKLFEESE